MKTPRISLIAGLTALFMVASLSSIVRAQETTTVLAGADLTRVLPTSFYFQGLNAPTQIRNGTGARFGTKRFVVAGLVDTSGYAADVRAKYEGFFITDSRVAINGSDLNTGAYGFGFSNDGKMQILDLGGNQIFSVTTTKDSALKRPRPLMMIAGADGLRLYSGKDYVVITPK